MRSVRFGCLAGLAGVALLGSAGLAADAEHRCRTQIGQRMSGTIGRLLRAQNREQEAGAPGLVSDGAARPLLAALTNACAAAPLAVAAFPQSEPTVLLARRPVHELPRSDRTARSRGGADRIGWVVGTHGARSDVGGRRRYPPADPRADRRRDAAHVSTSGHPRRPSHLRATRRGEVPIRVLLRELLRDRSSGRVRAGCAWHAVPSLGDPACAFRRPV
jgi:hypothetical protein